MKNILAEYQEVSATIKDLEASKTKLRLAIFAKMDANKDDELVIGNNKGKRELIDQFRMDKEKAQKILGDRYPEITSISTQTRLTVI